MNPQTAAASEATASPILSDAAPAYRVEALAAAYEKTLDCVHCGLCLPACPTYEVLHNEADSPRGRIYLMRAVAEGRLDLSESELPGPINRCLDCRACESACPSGVQYGAILEDMRSSLARGGAKRWKRAWLGRVLDAFVANKPLHRLSMHALALLQRTRLLRLARWIPMPHSMRQSLDVLPDLPPASERAPITPGVYEAYGERRAEVGLFVGCMMETVFGRVNRAVLEILRHNGCRVHVPEEQGCCGALHLHAGLRDRARRLVRNNLEAFASDLDAIILDSAGCGSAMKEYGHWMPEAAGFATKVKDLSEFLVALGPRAPQRAVVRHIAYDDACHLCHGQGIRSQPRELLAMIPGLSFADLERPEDCCGSAGIYNLQEPEIADRVLERKIDDIARTRADAVVTGNPGCMLQIGLGLRRRQLQTDVLHTAEVLAAAYGAPSDSD